MPNHDHIHFNRRSIRLPEYDYSQPGMYYVTVATQNGVAMFGEVVEDIMVLNDIGRIVENEWLKTSTIRPDVILDAFVVMPNHLHGILLFEVDRPASDDRTEFRSPSRTVDAVVRGFKAAVTRRVNGKRTASENKSIWHRNYYEHIVRNEADLHRIREYISANPANWKRDRANPINRK